MKVAIMQPTYMPWAGYLRLVARADRFVYLDDAQYERGTWHQRNRVLLNGRAHWLTVPVRRLRLGETLLEVQVEDAAHWRRKHLALVTNAYGRHPHADDALALMRLAARSTEVTSLALLNIALIEHCCEVMGLVTERLRSSTLGVGGARTGRVLSICGLLGATTYISPPGAREYLETDGFKEQAAIKLEFDEFPASAYPQQGACGFVSHLSVLDVVANIGWKGLARYIAGGDNAGIDP
ncbi:WbqC family protein [Acidovorax sp. ACV02]|uniref:WbqC family protein n=1 Tax=Acidovorax sp. ACV02 TaxID=2769310 RepID=UPI0017825028|nr:WbqC family protein [Acidovorax sp. ACV02]MBD9404212.1 WbqC family protein [Acidovorax sp. ACV02]